MGSVNLVTHTQELLANRPRTSTYKTIARETQLSPRWLSEFANNCQGGYDANRVQILYEYLSGKPLISV